LDFLHLHSLVDWAIAARPQQAQMALRTRSLLFLRAAARAVGHSAELSALNPIQQSVQNIVLFRSSSHLGWRPGRALHRSASALSTRSPLFLSVDARQSQPCSELRALHLTKQRVRNSI